MKNLFLIAFALMLASCSSTTSVNLEKTPRQKMIAYDGDRLAVSTKSRTVASLGSKTIGEPNGKTIDLLLIVENKKAAAFEVSSEAVKATINGIPVKTYTFVELVNAEKKKRNRDLAITAFAGAMQSVGAATSSGYQTTTGSYSGTTYGSYGSSNTYGTFNSTTYNQAAAQAASAQVQANTNNQMSAIAQRSDTALANLKSGYLKPTTMLRGTSYGGILKISAPKLDKDEIQIIELIVTLGSDKHKFKLKRRFDED